MPQQVMAHIGSATMSPVPVIDKGRTFIEGTRFKVQMRKGVRAIAGFAKRPGAFAIIAESGEVVTVVETAYTEARVDKGGEADTKQTDADALLVMLDGPTDWEELRKRAGREKILAAAARARARGRW